MGFFDSFLRLVFGPGSSHGKTTRDPPLCPSCNQALTPNSEGVFCCPGCHGMWLPNESFQAYLASEQVTPEMGGGGSAEHTYSRSASSRHCPACEERMDNYEFAYQSGIWVDACPQRHGVWLDAGELLMVRDYHRRTIGREATGEEKARMAMAFLDGAVATRSGHLKSLREIRQQQEACREWASDYNDHLA
ncbi:MAG: zf-TFIIB domain-containing protein [Vulcanimicrobiota bacterium]